MFESLFGFDRLDGELRIFDQFLSGLGLFSRGNSGAFAIDLRQLGAQGKRLASLAGDRNAGIDIPVLLRNKGLYLLFPVNDHACGDALYASG